MLSYTLSRREKALLLVLALIVLFLAWFMLVFQRTNIQVSQIESEIAAVQGDVAVANAKADKMKAMEEEIEQRKAAGAAARPVPEFDNMTPLMSELNRTLESTSNYTLSFDELDEQTSAEYVLRGVRADYSCDSVAEAEAVAGALENGLYPCVIDSITIADRAVGGNSRTVGVAGAASVSASVHVTFIERAQARG